MTGECPSLETFRAWQDKAVSPWQPALLQCRLDPWVKPCWLPGLLKGLCWWKCYCRYSLKNKKKACYCYKDGFPFWGNVKHFSFGGQPILCLLQGQQQLSGGSQVANLGQETPFLYLWAHKEGRGLCACLFIYFSSRDSCKQKHTHLEYLPFGRATAQICSCWRNWQWSDFSFFFFAFLKCNITLSACLKIKEDNEWWNSDCRLKCVSAM